MKKFSEYFTIGYILLYVIVSFVFAVILFLPTLLSSQYSPLLKYQAQYYPIFWINPSSSHMPIVTPVSQQLYNPSITMDVLKTSFIEALIVSFIGVFILALVLYGMNRLIICKSKPLRIIFRILFSAIIAMLGGLIINVLILEPFAPFYKTILFLIACVIIFVIAYFYFKRVQMREEEDRYIYGK